MLSSAQASRFVALARLSPEENVSTTQLEHELLKLYDEIKEVTLEFSLLKTFIALEGGLSNLPALTKRY